MKTFVLYVLKLVAIIVTLLYGLEFCYTQIHFNSKPRNKVDLAIQTNNEHFNVIALGSSRANNHINTTLFESKGFNAYNFGMNGATLEESTLLLKLLTDKNTIENVILEVDLQLRDHFISEGTRISFLPYLTRNQIIESYYKDKINNFNYLKYIPFYRYLIYDSKIGFRATFLKAISFPPKHLNNNGFNPLIGHKKLIGYDLVSALPRKNISYDNIKTICKIKAITLLPITTPMCQETNGISYFETIKQVYPEIINLEPVVNDDAYFYTCGHMNKAGADIFTNYLIDHYF